MFSKFTVRSSVSTFSTLKAKCARSAATAVIGLALLASTLFSAVRADDMQTVFIAGHDYVYYDSTNTPASSGTVADVTYGYDGGHVYDLNGNVMTVQFNGQITNSSNQVVGFVYSTPSGP